MANNKAFLVFLPFYHARELSVDKVIDLRIIALTPEEGVLS